jgi:hypothetical protein
MSSHQPSGRALAEVAPECVVLLVARDGDAERGTPVRLKVRSLAKLPPPALLVDERLADVEEHGRYGHRTSQALTLEVRQVCTKASTASDGGRPVTRLLSSNPGPQG